MKGRRWIAGVIAAMAALVLYAPALRFDFIGWDDGAYVTLNENVTGPGGLGAIWFTSDNEQYYPLTFTSYWLEYRLWGLDPTGYHATNLLLHALSAFLLTVLLQMLGMSSGAALFVSLIFAVHPLQVMSVAWVSARKNLLSGLFVLIATILWARFRTQKRMHWGAAAVAVFMAALLSKTAVGIVPLAWLVLDISHFKIPFRRAVKATGGLLLLSAVAVGATWVFEQKFLGAMPTLGDRLLIAARAVWTYVGLFLWPVAQTPIYPLWSETTLRSTGVLAAVFVLGGIALLYALRRRLPPVAKFGLAFAAAPLIPTLGFVPYGNMLVSYVSDHYMYLPVAGITMAFVALIPSSCWELTGVRGGLVAGGALIVGIASFSTRQYLPVFHDARSVWARTLAYNEACYPAHAGLARLEVAERNWDAAIGHLQRAVELEPQRREVSLSLAETYLQAGNLSAATRIFKSLQSEHADWAPPVLGLAMIAEVRGDFQTAIDLNGKATQLDPDNAVPHVSLGRIHLGQLRRMEAIAAFDAAIAAEPTEGAAYVGLATCYRGAGDHREAASILERGLRQAPNDLALLNALGRTLATSPDDSVRDGDRALALGHRANEAVLGMNLDILDTLAAAYAEVGDFDNAKAMIRQSIEIARRRGQESSIVVLQSRMALYESRRALREEAFRPVSMPP